MIGKTKRVRDWMKKAESDLAVVEMCLDKKQSLEAACFHAEQAAQKYLKAYLTANETRVPWFALMDDLEKLMQMCSEHDPSFLTIRTAQKELTPHVVQAKIDMDFEPSLDMARTARGAALKIKEFVAARLPAELKTKKEE